MNDYMAVLDAATVVPYIRDAARLGPSMLSGVELSGWALLNGERCRVDVGLTKDAERRWFLCFYGGDWKGNEYWTISEERGFALRDAVRSASIGEWKEDWSALLREYGLPPEGR